MSETMSEMVERFRKHKLTLGQWRARAVQLFGADAGALRFLDWKIAQQGEGELVLADEGQVLLMLAHVPDDWTPERDGGLVDVR